MGSKSKAVISIKINEIKSRFYILLIIFFSANFYTQDMKKNIENDFTNYIHIFLDKNFDEIPKYSYPEMKEYIEEGENIKYFKESFSDRDEVKIKFSNPEINSISDIYQIENKYYSIVDYSNILIFDFSDKSEKSSTMHKKILEYAYGKGNVYYFEKEKHFKVLVLKKIIARLDNATDGWKFLVLHEGSMKLIREILPNIILEKIFK